MKRKHFHFWNRKKLSTKRHLKEIHDIVSHSDDFIKNNWKQENFERNVIEGVKSLREGKPIVIHDDGRGYELALAIKQQFILDYQRQLAERIKITGSDTIHISLKHD